MKKPVNHRKRYTQRDNEKLERKAASFQTKADMYNEASKLSKEYGRTETAICRKIEQINTQNGREGWFWAKRA